MAAIKKSATAKKSVKTLQASKKNKMLRDEGSGDFYLIEVRPISEFQAFRYHVVGDSGRILRLAGLLDDGTWEDQAWIISKQDAHVEDNFLKADSKQAQQVLDIYGPAHHVSGDVFIRKLRKEAR